MLLNNYKKVTFDSCCTFTSIVTAFDLFSIFCPGQFSSLSPSRSPPPRSCPPLESIILFADPSPLPARNLLITVQEKFFLITLYMCTV
jgi:hypothetical protein